MDTATKSGTTEMDPFNKMSLVGFLVTYHGSLHPPSGHSMSKSTIPRNILVRFGCRSHFTGSPLYMQPDCLSKLNSCFHSSLPFRASRKVCGLPIIIRPSRARESRTFKRSGAEPRISLS